MSTNTGESVLTLDGGNTIITLNPASQFPIKLDGDNFPTWRAQLFTLLRGLDLLKFLDGTHPRPSADADPAAITHWFRQDQLLLHAVIASVTPAVAPYVTSATSSHDAWMILERMFAGQSRQRVINLKGKLLRETQGARPVAVYLQAMRSTAAELALVNAPVSHEDMVLHILCGLRDEFSHLAAAIRARDTTIQIEDLHDRLVDFEADMAAARVHQPAPTTAFSTARGRPHTPNFISRSAGTPRRDSPSPSFYGSDARRDHSPRSPRGSYSPRSGFSNSPPASSLLGRPQLRCQFCDKLGHSAKDCYRIRGRPQAHHTATAAPSHSGWLIDSAATNHMTPDLGNLSLYTDYAGPDEVLISDGSGSSHGGASSTRPE
ncbi:unnamed protein product [Linum trigynum]|uniref:CCHC-type domain-containing protein n=1 Tax=Linum trigynum TaxID=586398 RepID=A0AAV2ESH8_9ROSI